MIKPEKKSFVMWADKGIFKMKKNDMKSSIKMDHSYNFLYSTPFNPNSTRGEPFTDFHTGEDVIKVRITIEEIL